MRRFSGDNNYLKQLNEICNPLHNLLLVIVFKDVERLCRRTVEFSVIHLNLGRSTETDANGVSRPLMVNV